MSNSTQLLLGLPNSGKTTFLAALWHVVTSGEVTDSLKLDVLHTDVEYLNAISEKWLSFQDIGRTLGAKVNKVSMRLQDRSGQTAEIVFPDIWGEVYQAQWVDREWDQEFAALVAQSPGSLLFIHPTTVSEPTLIDEINAIMSVLPTTPAEENENAIDEEVEWNPEHAPTQVKLVEIVQFLQSGSVRRPYKIAIVISAWDLLAGAAISPERWVAQRLPLLSQFIITNDDVFEVKFYGISALGGKLVDEHLKEHLIQSERIKVSADGSESHDVTLPIKWIMA